MNSSLILNISRFIMLVLAQVIIFNNVNFYGYINPYIYILFIAFFPVRDNRLTLIFVSFLIGLTIDMFLDSGGMHAAASVFIAYMRPLLLRWSFGTLYEHQTIRFTTIDFGPKISYLILLTFAHHLVLFTLEFFSISKTILILQKTLFCGIFTVILSIILSIIFSRKTK